jgi:hypothetical protein
MKKLILICLALTLCLEVLAWGATGHRAIGEIAERHLTKKARKALKKLLDNESIAFCGPYMDEIKSDDRFDSLYTWHFVTIPDGQLYEDITKEPQGDIIESIERIIRDLKSDRLTKEEKIFSLKVLIHLIGDVHQPLHVGRPGDRGGNDIKVEWFYISSYNLHRVWDEGMIDFSNLSYTEFADNLTRQMDKDQIKLLQQSNVRDWAYESMSYRDTVYDIGDGKLGYRYTYVNFPILKKRMAEAGVRLAGVLNDIFG